MYTHGDFQQETASVPVPEKLPEKLWGEAIGARLRSAWLRESRR